MEWPYGSLGLLNKFKTFYAENQPYDMESLVEFFSVFGGTNLEIDIDALLQDQITTHILDNYGELYNKVTALILDDSTYSKLLRAIAKGDRRTHSAFKYAHLGEYKGNIAVNFLIDLNILEREPSREAPVQKIHPKQKLPRDITRHKISDKLTITIPFIRFWFYFIAPNHHSIIKGEYEPFLEHYKAQKNNFNSYTYEQLSHYLLNETFQSDPIVDSKSYWDRNVEIDILALTKSMKIIVGECKWTNHKMNKKELGKLNEKCKTIFLNPDYIVLFSKRGFSNELQSMQSKKLLLFKASDLELLLKN